MPAALCLHPSTDAIHVSLDWLAAQGARRPDGPRDGTLHSLPSRAQRREGLLPQAGLALSRMKAAQRRESSLPTPAAAGAGLSSAPGRSPRIPGFFHFTSKDRSTSPPHKREI